MMMRLAGLAVLLGSAVLLVSGWGLPRAEGDGGHSGVAYRAESPAQQVARGAEVWADACAACHGDRGEGKGKKKPPVVGKKALGNFNTAADLQRYIKAKMPKDDPGSLTVDDAWAVTAWILGKNGKRLDAVLSEANGGKTSIR